MSAAEEMKEQSEQLEREQLALTAAQKKAEKELSWKCGVRDHLEKFAEVREKKREGEKGREGRREKKSERIEKIAQEEE